MRRICQRRIWVRFHPNKHVRLLLIPHEISYSKSLHSSKHLPKIKHNPFDFAMRCTMLDPSNPQMSFLRATNVQMYSAVSNARASLWGADSSMHLIASCRRAGFRCFEKCRKPFFVMKKIWKRKLQRGTTC